MKTVFQRPTIYKQFGLKSSSGTTSFGTRCRPTTSIRTHGQPEAPKPPEIEKN
jgi:hypothetical protein